MEHRILRESVHIPIKTADPYICPKCNTAPCGCDDWESGTWGQYLSCLLEDEKVIS